jgi:hypothetical protein
LAIEGALMTMIEMRIWVEAGDGRAPEVQAFVDLEPDCGLGAENVLPLQQLGHHEWVGMFCIADRATRFLYRVGIAAEEGADWSLTVRDRGLELDLFSDADSLPASKSWFVGSCPLASARSKTALGGAGYEARPRATPHAARPGSLEQGTVIYLDRHRAAR